MFHIWRIRGMIGIIKLRICCFVVHWGAHFLLESCTNKKQCDVRINQLLLPCLEKIKRNIFPYYEDKWCMKINYLSRKTQQFWSLEIHQFRRLSSKNKIKSKNKLLLLWMFHLYIRQLLAPSSWPVLRKKHQIVPWLNPCLHILPSSKNNITLQNICHC